MLKTEAIKNFLNVKARSDLAERYNNEMEVQVNVAQDNGTKIDGEYKGHKFISWTDDIQTWKSIRIPYKANSEPEYTDSKITFDLAVHAEGIGLTGWNWVKRESIWVAFDFDGIAGHSDKHTKKLTEEQLKEIIDIVWSIPWITIRRSTSGNGLHLYVFVNNIKTQNHNEHAALARAILGKLCALTGFDFNTKVDCCGSNIWIWHRKFEACGGLDGPGLKIIKNGETLEDIPPNWSDHINVIAGKRKTNIPNFVKDSDTFEEFCGQHNKTTLDSEHKKLMGYLDEIKALWWFDTDHHLLVCHTYDLLQAHKTLNLHGVFKTVATGRNQGSDQNCFAYPERGGAWIIRRHTPGIQEADSWDQDAGGWTRCYFNKEPDLNIASRTYSGIEHPTGGFVFKKAEDAMLAAKALGSNIDLPKTMKERETKLKTHKDGRLIIELNHEINDDLKGWLQEKGKWTKIFNTKLPTHYEPEISNYDDIVRHIVTEMGNIGWVIRRDNNWCNEPIKHIELALIALGVQPKDIRTILGSIVMKAWILVNRPFEPEYPGDRCWNCGAAQLVYPPSSDIDNIQYDTWNKILNHCGDGLSNSIKSNEWCKKHGINSGGDYLKLWLASMFQKPLEPLPYLFFYGPQNSGKSTFHEAVSLLVTKGVVRADTALMTNFNAELENAVFCIIEETDLREKKSNAYNKIKDLVTSKTISIHPKGKTPYEIPNSTHWAQFSNNIESCPIFPGDTRITVIYVDDLKEFISKNDLHHKLQKEASDFIAFLLSLEIPKSPDRLNIPVIETEEKRRSEQYNLTELEIFINEKCHYSPGYIIKFSDFYDKFKEWLDPESLHRWSKIRVGRELPDKYSNARNMKELSQVYVINISWELQKEKLEKITIKNGRFSDGMVS